VPIKEEEEEEEDNLGDLVIDGKRITLLICFTKLLHLQTVEAKQGCDMRRALSICSYIAKCDCGK